jgi:transposase
MNEQRFVVTDRVWRRLEPLLPGKSSDAGATAKDNRLFLEAVFWRVRTGFPWRDLPPAFGNWNSQFRRFRRWAKTGVIESLFIAMSGDPDLEYALIDGTIVQVHQVLRQDLATVQSGLFRGKSKISKYGNARLRRVLWLASQAAVLKPANSFRDKFERYISQDRHNLDLRRKAYTAIAAKMARTIHAVIKSGEPYRPFFEGASPSGRTPFYRAVEAPTATS